MLSIWTIIVIVIVAIAIIAMIAVLTMRHRDNKQYAEAFGGDRPLQENEAHIAEAHGRTQRNLLVGAGVAGAVALIAAVALIVLLQSGLAFAGQSEKQSLDANTDVQSEQAVEEATEDATQQLADSVNEAAEHQRLANEASSVTADNLNVAQANTIFPAGQRILMSQESLPTQYATLVKATGVSDAAALPHTKSTPDKASALQDLMKEAYDKDTGSTNTPYVLGTLCFFRKAYVVWFGCEPDMPELIRLTDLYQAKGIAPFVLTNADGKYILTADGQQWFANGDAKIAAAMYKALFDEMTYGGVKEHRTLMNFHGNSALTITDHRICENPVQYEGKFHVWSLIWKGQNLFQFGTNCGSAEGSGDKRPALFDYEVATSTSESDGGGSPGGGGGDSPDPTPVNPPTSQNYKDPNQDPVNQGNAPVGGGKNDDPGPGTFEETDHSAGSSGASSDAGNDDGSSKPSNQVQDPSAAQDNSTPPKTEEIPVTHDTTVTDNQSGQTTNTSTEKPNKGKVDPD